MIVALRATTDLVGWRSGTRSQRHLDSIARPHRHAVLQHDLLSRHQLKRETLRQRRQDQLCLRHRERHPDAHARPAAERNEREAMPSLAPLRRETLGIESERILPQREVAMYEP